MKAVGHAWVALMALERLKSRTSRGFLGKNFKSYFLGGTFGDDHFNRQAELFVRFFDKHKDAFVKGAWFPDSVISDNLTGAHTLKMKAPSSDREKKAANQIKNRIPAHLSSGSLINDESRFNEEVYMAAKYILPDRCEALSHAIRDMLLIYRDEPKGSNIMFNNDQITLYFLMLSHYLADAHVPPHCDARDFYTPPTIHPDMEEYWDDEVKSFYEFDKKGKTFDYDIAGAPELTSGKEADFEGTFLYKAIEVLSERKWKPSNRNILGKGNRKVYDYSKAVCFVSYLISTDFIPKMPKADYKNVKIREQPEYKEQLEEISVHVFADAIDSIALVWLLTWNKYNKLKDDIKKKTKEIKSKGGKIAKRI
jgi:hypothetical protein